MGKIMTMIFFIAMIFAAIGVYLGFATLGFKSNGVKRTAFLIIGWIIGLFFILAVSSLLKFSVSGSNDASMAYIVASIVIYVVKRKYSNKSNASDDTA
jgi:fatty acid desaturase